MMTLADFLTVFVRTRPILAVLSVSKEVVVEGCLRWSCLSVRAGCFSRLRIRVPRCDHTQIFGETGGPSRALVSARAFASGDNQIRPVFTSTLPILLHCLVHGHSDTEQDTITPHYLRSVYVVSLVPLKQNFARSPSKHTSLLVHPIFLICKGIA